MPPLLRVFLFSCTPLFVAVVSVVVLDIDGAEWTPVWWGSFSLTWLALLWWWVSIWEE